MGSLFQEFSCEREDGDRIVDKVEQRFVCL